MIAIVFRRLDVIPFLAVFPPEVIGIYKKAWQSYSSGGSVAVVADELSDKVCECVQMLWRLVIEVIYEIQTFFYEIRNVVGKAVAFHRRIVGIVQIKLSNPFASKPIVCRLESVFLRDLAENLVHRQELLVRLAHLVFQRDDILMSYVCISVDTCIGYRVFIDKVIDEVCVTKLPHAKSVQLGQRFSKLGFQFIQRDGKISV